MLSTSIEGISPTDRIAEYKKYLRYYLDFCDKYPVPDAKSERVRLFAEKLRDKKQSQKQLNRAAHAVSLYFEMQKHEKQAPGVVGAERLPTHTDRPRSVAEGNDEYEAIQKDSAPTASNSTQPQSVPDPSTLVTTHLQQQTSSRRSSQYSAAGYEEKSDSPEWDAVLTALAGEIKVRHSSRKSR